MIGQFATEELERTITAMEQTSICADSRSYHSFQTTTNNLLVLMGSSGVLRNCAACDQRIQPVLFGSSSSDSSKQIVKCVACGVVAHRTCVSSRRTKWKQVCPVNQPKIESALSQSHGQCLGLVEPELVTDENDNENLWQECTAESSKEQEKPHSASMQWKNTGPPPNHGWAASTSSQHDPKSIAIPTITIPTSVEDDENDDGNADYNGDDGVHVTPLHHADHPFASVSRALQENIIAHFFANKNSNNNILDQNRSNNMGQPPPPTSSSSSRETTAVVAQALSVKREKTKREDDECQEQPMTLAKLASGTIQAVRTTVNLPARFGMATVAGGIAGGVAGLAMAGPAGKQLSEYIYIYTYTFFCNIYIYIYI